MKQWRRDLSFLLPPKILDENFKVAFFYYVRNESVIIPLIRFCVLAAALGSVFEVLVCFGQSSVADVIDGMSQ
jgi:hypothetical protein